MPADEELRHVPIADLVGRLQSASSPEDSSPYFAEIIRRFEPLLRKAWRRVPWIDYADFAQDAFMRLFRSLPRLKVPAAFPGFFHAIMLSVVADLWRHRSEEEPLSDSLAEILAAVEEATQSELVLRSYAELLDEPERTIVLLDLIEGCSSEEIAARLGWTAGGVRSAKSRALRQLRKQIEAEADALEKNHRR
ncbi:MAG TPA: sigma-70 family RNA polymerase sigma factor [Thermoanaerobaculia bacterium]|nr:sigma-70 family RNA polymerase sigma factor [Thermoanaerobaculia bacterium]